VVGPEPEPELPGSVVGPERLEAVGSEVARPESLAGPESLAQPELADSRVVVVELLDGSVVLVEVLDSGVVVLVVLDALVEGSVVVVMLVVLCAWRSLLECAGAEVVDLVARVVLGTSGTGTGARVVGGTMTVVDEVCRGRSVVVVLWATAWAACLGVVSIPTRLPPIAPSSTAATTLSHRRAAT